MNQSSTPSIGDQVKIKERGDLAVFNQIIKYANQGLGWGDVAKKMGKAASNYDLELKAVFGGRDRARYDFFMSPTERMQFVKKYYGKPDLSAGSQMNNSNPFGL
jgi:hypothetical protein